MEDYSPKVGYATETEQEWRRRLDHRLSNIERMLLHLRDAVTNRVFPNAEAIQKYEKALREWK
jgi:hypothetical protein